MAEAEEVDGFDVGDGAHFHAHVTVEQSAESGLLQSGRESVDVHEALQLESGGRIGLSRDFLPNVHSEVSDHEGIGNAESTLRDARLSSFVDQDREVDGVLIAEHGLAPEIAGSDDHVGLANIESLLQRVVGRSRRIEGADGSGRALHGGAAHAARHRESCHVFGLFMVL